MFVKNRTAFDVQLARTHLAEGLFAASLSLTVALRLSASALEPWGGRRASLMTDPPDLKSEVLWQGASLTIAGQIQGPGRPPHVAHVDLDVASEKKRLVVSGDREWVRNGGRLVASTAAPWDRLAMSWTHAFGGATEIPPGPFGPSGLPHPGGRVQHPHNPLGKGFSAGSIVAGVALPNIESANALIKSTEDRPEPAGFAPCPHLPGLRIPASATSHTVRSEEAAFLLGLRLRHVAPGDLIFPSLPPGTPLRLTGMVGGPIQLEVPRCPVNVVVQKGNSRTTLGALVRAVHISTDDGAVLVTYGHLFSYEQAPSWVHVLTA